MYDEIDDFEINIQKKTVPSSKEPVTYTSVPISMDENTQAALKEELKEWKEYVIEIKLKDKDLMTAEDYKDKRIIDLYRQIRTINRRIRIEQVKKTNLEREWGVHDSKNNNKNIVESEEYIFIDPNQPTDNEAELLKKRYKKLANELSLIRMEFMSMKSLYSKMIRAFNLGFSHALKHETKFKSNRENIINDNNLEEAMDYLENEDFGFKGTAEYIEDYTLQLKNLQKTLLNSTKNSLKSNTQDLYKTQEQKDENEEIKAKLKKDIEDLQAILEYKDNDSKLCTKKYHQALAKKRLLDSELSESKQQVKFLLDNDTKCRNIIESQKQVILNLDRKRRGEDYQLVLKDGSQEIDSNIRSLEQEIDQIKMDIKIKHSKSDKTINDLIKENNELKKKLTKAKAK